MNIYNIVEKVKESFSSLGGAIALIFDIIVFCFIFFLFFRIVKKKIKLSILIGVYFFLIAGIAVSYAFSMTLTFFLFTIIAFWAFGALVIVYSQELKHFFEGHNNSKMNNVIDSKEEKENMIKVLVAAAKQLSDRSVGALITIEREDNLNSIIENAIQINSVITKELITTIFTPGTACHDGAMIIRKDRIVCAAAYLPTTEKYDIPKYLGTRHRAAIGVSEKYDAITIVVSEETGKISLTSEGVINLDLTTDRLEEMLDRFIENN